MDTNAIRSFVLAADLGRLQHAADELGVTQQGVSKRITGLERELGVRLFRRTARGVEPTLDGQAFLAHARTVVAHLDRAVAAVRPGSRTLRVDVLGLRTAQAVILHEFWRSTPGIDLDVVSIRVDDPLEVAAAVRAGEVDAAFRTVTDRGRLPDGLRMVRAYDSPLELLVGPRHPLAAVRVVTPEQLRGQRIWIPGMAPRTEWSEFYDELTEAFDLSIDAAGPNFGTEVLIDELAESPDVATLVGSRDRYVWPSTHDLRRIPIADPPLAYPISIIMPSSDPHAGLDAIVDHFHRQPRVPESTWLPSWAPEPLGRT
ncbi:LysR family transcriptional regulator [Gordonia soli]|uniref:Putative LysR family transcriptional regulator n=1 Tax=Gordonia soli NBRC 108243 TaxID=1223545 RepID=M0QEM4_9ACTN|nr:LysR family transcriptional regulator [Gordonia soli]GAC67045.1 putative LysR family transcriptional regulator [Gordonia soli NBRC 108243]